MQLPPTDETGLEARGSNPRRSAGQLTGASTAEGPGAGAGAASSSLALTAEAPAGQQIHHASAKLDIAWPQERQIQLELRARSSQERPSERQASQSLLEATARGAGGLWPLPLLPGPMGRIRCPEAAVGRRPASTRQLSKGSMLTCQEGEEGCGLHSASDVFGR